ncbi:MAG: hypothetical protein AB7R89_17515 [Dehalococcoidia bacterium]
MIDPAAVTVLTDGCGRGFTVLCTIREIELLASLASIAGPTGLVIAGGREPAPGDTWRPVRCAPALGIPVRSHVIDTAVIAATADLAEMADEVRRVLVPGGDVRVLLVGAADAGAVLRDAAIEPLRQDSGVLIARGP